MTDITRETSAPTTKTSAAKTSGRATEDDMEGMSYLETLPRKIVTTYMPLSLIVFVLLFPFYWMALTSVKPDEQLLDLETVNPFWTTAPIPINKKIGRTMWMRMSAIMWTPVLGFETTS